MASDTGALTVISQIVCGNHNLLISKEGVGWEKQAPSGGLGTQQEFG